MRTLISVCTVVGRKGRQKIRAKMEIEFDVKGLLVSIGDMDGIIEAAVYAEFEWDDKKHHFKLMKR